MHIYENISYTLRAQNRYSATIFIDKIRESMETERWKLKTEKYGVCDAYKQLVIPRRSIRGGVGCAKVLYSDVGIYRSYISWRVVFLRISEGVKQR